MVAKTVDHRLIRGAVTPIERAGVDAVPTSKQEAGPAKHTVTDVLTSVWLAVTTIWTLYFFHGLLDSRAVIVSLEQELGRTVDVSQGTPIGFNELHGAFCGHGFRGESVNSTFANALALAFGGFVAYGSGAALLLTHLSRWAKERSRRLSFAMGAVVVVQVSLMILFLDTINIVTYFGD